MYKTPDYYEILQISSNAEPETVHRVYRLLAPRFHSDNVDTGHEGLAAQTGRAREHLEFTIWYLTQKKHVSRSDGSMLVITVDGVEYLEKNFQEATQGRRLNAGPTPVHPMIEMDEIPPGECGDESKVGRNEDAVAAGERGDR